MYRIRIHGRGGQGIKTAGRILGSAFLREGFEVQDAPRYGAERRGAPISAYVRAGKSEIHERGIIRRPDLVIVVDDTLAAVPSAGVMAGATADTVLFIISDEEGDTWRTRLAALGPVVALPPPALGGDGEAHLAGIAGVGAAARLTGAISAENLAAAIRDEVGSYDAARLPRSLEVAAWAFDAMAAHAGAVKARDQVGTANQPPPDWVDLVLEPASRAAPAIHAGLTSMEVRTGLWRIMRPVIDYERCNRCTWVCGSFCPDSAIAVREDGFPQIDYDHCKGCMICVVQCPPHAIEAIPERDAARSDDVAKEEGAA